MPAPNYSDPPLFNWMRNIKKRVTNLEKAFTGYRDLNGLVRVKYGQLYEQNGITDYGIAVIDPIVGVTTELLPLYEANVLTTQSTSSTTYTNLTTPGPSLTATTTAAGTALVVVNSYIGVTGVADAQSAGFVGVSIDGNTPADPLDEVLYFSVTSGSQPVGIAGNQSASVIISGLTPGQHTFEMVYKTVGGEEVNFSRGSYR